MESAQRLSASEALWLLHLCLASRYRLHRSGWRALLRRCIPSSAPPTGTAAAAASEAPAAQLGGLSPRQQLLLVRLMSQWQMRWARCWPCWHKAVARMTAGMEAQGAAVASGSHGKLQRSSSSSNNMSQEEEMEQVHGLPLLACQGPLLLVDTRPRDRVKGALRLHLELVAGQQKSCRLGRQRKRQGT